MRLGPLVQTGRLRQFLGDTYSIVESPAHRAIDIDGSSRTENLGEGGRAGPTSEDECPTRILTNGDSETHFRNRVKASYEEKEAE